MFCYGNVPRDGLACTRATDILRIVVSKFCGIEMGLRRLEILEEERMELYIPRVWARERLGLDSILLGPAQSYRQLVFVLDRGTHKGNFSFCKLDKVLAFWVVLRKPFHPFPR